VAIPRLGIRRRLKAAARRVNDMRHRRGLRKLAEGGPDDYRQYLEAQLQRSLKKRANDPGIGARVLVDLVALQEPPQAGAILCVGCRNGFELDEFRARGYDVVVGIDLFSQRPDIRVMDMHDMTFPDDSFDVVYASHALEHSYHVEKVVLEIARVAKEGAVVAVEVPVRYRDEKPGATDITEFPGVDSVQQAFGKYIGELLWAEEQPAKSATNAQAVDIARIVFRLHKDAAAREISESAASGAKPQT
jgi:SAM-dependent methyltransferase